MNTYASGYVTAIVLVAVGLTRLVLLGLNHWDGGAKNRFIAYGISFGLLSFVYGAILSAFGHLVLLPIDLLLNRQKRSDRDD